MQNDTASKNGMLMIPDISGFTDFVIKSNMFVGKYITESLLKSVMDSNILCLEVSEVEGDAILYTMENLPNTKSENLRNFMVHL